jgi:hypothetical protein
VRKTFLAAVAALVCVVVVGVVLWTRQQVPAAPPPRPEPAVAEPAPEPPASAAAASASDIPIQHPIEAPTTETSAAPPDVRESLIQLFGRKAVVSMFQTDEFPRRFVATVDNLTRRHAASRLWPVNPALGRFEVEARGDGTVVSADNALRYTPFVLLVETVDLDAAVGAYRQLYPQFQQAYEDLGYPRSYFNDRLVQLIDLLLATPTTDAELKVQLPPINSPIQPERPWVLYQFDDPALEALTSGQRLLLRMGPVNARRLKSKLAEVRRLIAAGDMPARESGTR